MALEVVCPIQRVAHLIGMKRMRYPSGLEVVVVSCLCGWNTAAVQAPGEPVPVIDYGGIRQAHGEAGVKDALDVLGYAWGKV